MAAQSDAFYQELLPTIEDVFEQFGAEVTIHPAQNYDREFMRPGGGGEPRKVLGVVNNTAIGSSLSTQIFAVIETSQNWKSSVQLLLPPSAAPQPDEEVEVDGKRYSLGQMTTLKPGNITLLYTVGLSK